MDIDLLVLLRHSAPEPPSPRGKVHPFPFSEDRIVFCRRCGESAILTDEETPEDRGYHRDYGRWFYCADCSEEGKDDE